MASGCEREALGCFGHGTGAGDERLGRLGGQEAARGAGEEREAEISFEPFDLTAERRLGEA